MEAAWAKLAEGSRLHWVFPAECHHQQQQPDSIMQAAMRPFEDGESSQAAVALI
eukprot:m.48507 g.48507  ORF g.48507 m.48507 type:complete len:54 (+) comp13291_c0_seq8:981-1142(+)